MQTAGNQVELPQAFELIKHGESISPVGEQVRDSLSHLQI
jgi:hypothetical protein